MKTAEMTSKERRPVTEFRYESEEHRELVREAAEKDGRSVNAWIISVTIQAARKQLARA